MYLVAGFVSVLLTFVSFFGGLIAAAFWDLSPIKIYIAYSLWILPAWTAYSCFNLAQNEYIKSMPASKNADSDPANGEQKSA